MKYAVTVAGLVLALVGAVFVSITHRDSDWRLSCVADIVLLVALLVALLVLCAALLAWEYARMNIPSRSLFKPDGENRRDWQSLLAITAMLAFSLLLLAVQFTLCMEG